MRIYEASVVWRMLFFWVAGWWLQVTGYKVQVAGYRLQGAGYRLQRDDSVPC
ncbi:MAG: hypothetical protein K0Q66_421 [Chitinophagaceae bacterium]|nr:hypothetical protein [Chitinophagaceae bacterium]